MCLTGCSRRRNVIEEEMAIKKMAIKKMAIEKMAIKKMAIKKRWQ